MMRRTAVMAICTNLLLSPPLLAETLVLRADETKVSVVLSGGQPGINVRLTRESARDFALFTSKQIGEQVHIRINGELMTSPVIQTPMEGGSLFISGKLDENKAKALAILIREGGNLTIDDEPL
jgi:preprotein translocase subunit SecD